MMLALRLGPTILSCWLLAAHFLRAGDILPGMVAVALPGVLALRRIGAVRVVQVFLVLGCAEWLRTTFAIARFRIASGQPWVRMAIILTAVAGFAALGAMLLGSRGTRRLLLGAARSPDQDPTSGPTT